MMRRALIAGIDNYDTARSLAGCVNDAQALVPLLERHEDGRPNFAPLRLLADTLQDSRVTRDELLEGLDQLLSPGADMSLLFFSGHGAANESGDDVWLCTSDATSATPGVRFSEVSERVGNCDQHVVIILDCCFSGGAGGVPAALTRGDVLRPGLAILTASRGDQVSYETGGRGLFSTFLETALEGGAADILGSVNVAGLYGYLSEAFGPWDQRPVFKASIDRLHNIRDCDPKVSPSTLRRLPEWFPTPNHHYPLDPSYEPDKTKSGLDPHPKHEGIFKQLQDLRAVELLEPVDEDHMYYAAMHNRACRLTRVGKHYRDLVERGLL